MKNISENLKSNNIRVIDEDCEIELVSYGLDSINMMFEFNLKLSEKCKDINSPQLFIETFTLKDDNNKEYGTEHFNIQTSYCSKIKKNEYKIFNVISFLDEEFVNNCFMDNIVKNSNRVFCKLIIGVIEDTENDEQINLTEEIEFKISKDIIKNNLKNINILYKEQKYKDIDIEIKSIKASTYGNIILLNVKKEESNFNKIEDINKLDFIIKDSKGNRVNVIKRFNQVFVCNYDKGKMNGKELEVLLIVDYNEDLNYSIEAFECDKVIVDNIRFKNANRVIIDKLKLGDYVLTADDQLYITDDEVDIAGYGIDKYGVYFCNKTYNELKQIAKIL